MTTKLTLTIEESVIVQAKKYAAQSGHSLSSIVENYLKSLQKETGNKKKYSPVVQKLIGSVPLPVDFDYKDFLTDELTKKYKG